MRFSTNLSKSDLHSLLFTDYNGALVVGRRVTFVSSKKKEEKDKETHLIVW